MRTSILLLLAFVLAAGAFAQGDKTQPISVSAGIYWPGAAELKDDIGKTWFNVNLHYLVGMNYEKQARSEVTVGYSRRKEGSLKGSVVPVTWDLTWSKPVENRTASTYYGVGAGVCWLRYETATTQDSSWGLAATAKAGVQWNNGLFAEVRYLWTGDLVRSINAQGLSLSLGTRLKL